jgi:hypothetical protein
MPPKAQTWDEIPWPQTRRRGRSVRSDGSCARTAERTHQQLQIPGTQLSPEYAVQACSQVSAVAAPAVAPAADKHVAGVPDLMTAHAVSPDAAGAVSDVAAIPSSVLGGADGEKGILTQVCYDGSGGSDIGAAFDAIADATKLADLEFLSQPLSGAEEPTGIFHGSSALHLV